MFGVLLKMRVCHLVQRTQPWRRLHVHRQVILVGEVVWQLAAQQHVGRHTHTPHVARTVVRLAVAVEPREHLGPAYSGQPFQGLA